MKRVIKEGRRETALGVISMQKNKLLALKNGGPPLPSPDRVVLPNQEGFDDY